MQLGKIAPPRIVGFIQNAKDVTNFELFKSSLEPGTEAATFTDGNQTDIQKYVDIIQKSSIAVA